MLLELKALLVSKYVWAAFAGGAVFGAEVAAVLGIGDWAGFWGGATAFITALGVAVLAALQIWSKMEIDRQLAAQKEEVSKVADNMKKVEHNTNSMREALVTATRTEATLTGANEERKRVAEIAAAEQAGVIRGVDQERERAG